MIAGVLVQSDISDLAVTVEAWPTTPPRVTEPLVRSGYKAPVDFLAQQVSVVWGSSDPRFIVASGYRYLSDGTLSTKSKGSGSWPFLEAPAILQALATAAVESL